MCNVWQQSKHFAFTYYSKFFASCFPEGFCPLYFAGVSLHLEVLVALWTAKSEDLQCIVNKLHIKINSINKFKLSLPLFIRELYESLRGLISVTSLSKLWLISVVVWIKSLRHNYRIPGPFSRYNYISSSGSEACHLLMSHQAPRPSHRAMHTYTCLIL